MFRIKTYNKISLKGLERFSREFYELSSDTTHPDAYILRSHKLYDEVIPDTLKAVARAGAGVNNIPVDDYTQKGIVVFNTPGANANAVKELVMAGMLLGSRGIIEGVAYTKSLNGMSDTTMLHKQLEAEKKRFAGRELAGKTLGVVGLGAIGSLVAEMALSMGMKVLGYDPAISVEAAWRLPSQVQKMENLQALLAKVDFVSLHVPAIEATHHLINADILKSIKPGAILLNFARESIVDPEAIVMAINANQLGLYICDFPEPCFMGNDKVIAMPHIGASTVEAEDNCAMMAANQLIDYLENGNINHSVNFPSVLMSRADGCRLTFVNHNVAGVLGDVLSVFTKHQVNVIDMVNKSQGDIAYNIIDLESEVGELMIADINAIEHVIALRLLK
ncbi:3-phosphoglycerate dehydrogenase [Candidatus Endobugula sertula]|uniref:D-3-phosphoglycerate dehydrogenase n=1 Tax=Candidatus Endobugula sertula TaxID=62101 RepID=A0A1D2QMK8_9GAMM|nr:3-phosphoglycerate dehydrogenase [Candidatus Endobugula sertula]